ncbi:MAG: hypothetical protein N2053_11805 [Chitinispirillaceae bacterium]|nr:hypothetical protein [Chitinispirillaceae bacterium]
MEKKIYCNSDPRNEMIRNILFLLWFLLLDCRNHRDNKESEYLFSCKDDSIISEISTNVQINKINNFYSLLGMDSIARSDYFFVDYIIDSISTKKIIFDAIYLECFKGNIHLNNFNYLMKTDISDYRAISNSHTAHFLIVDKIGFPFDGKGNIRCFAESTKVEVKATVYSFFFNKKGLGKFIILDSIKNKITKQK